MEKRITSPLMEPSSIEKVVEIDHHIGCAMSGLTADARTMIDRARVEAQNYWFTYNEPMPTESVTQVRAPYCPIPCAAGWQVRSGCGGAQISPMSLATWRSPQTCDFLFQPGS